MLGTSFSQLQHLHRHYKPELELLSFPLVLAFRHFMWKARHLSVLEQCMVVSDSPVISETSNPLHFSHTAVALIFKEVRYTKTLQAKSGRVVRNVL
ncbi:hypothetical protein AVEN_23217-1 [Araneus ventricosus]|uniref:Uncharacterized protein n=1 Tax=Araneus ventricosus TaxID=182803 RepID=A0A4Y2MBL9_ARAVE|nr:hypothetical protein AVEN_23217-1 [Araneus ventricosus]